MSAPSSRRVAVPTAARAALAAVLALVTTFWPQPDRTAAFGLTALGGFLLVQAGVLAAAARVLPEDRTGRALVLARAAASLVGGIAAVVALLRGTAPLVPVEALSFLVIGVLEVLGAVRRTSAPTAGDAVVVGGLQIVVGLILVILNPDPLLAIGVLTAWSAVVAVYLGIAAANLRRRGAPA